MTRRDFDRDESEARLEDWFRRYHKPLIAYLQSAFSFSREDARDLAQDTFLRVYRSSREYRGEAEWAFLKTTAHNLALNLIRDANAGKRRGKNVAIEEASELRDTAPPVDVTLARQETTALAKKRLVAAIAELPDTIRTPVVLRMQNRSYEDIRTALGLTMDAVKSRLHEARRRLRTRLGDDLEGIDWADLAAEESDDRKE